MIHITIKMEGLKGIKFTPTEVEKQILQHYIKQCLEWHHEINAETVAKYLESVKIIREGMPKNQEVENAMYWLTVITQESRTITEVKVR